MGDLLTWDKAVIDRLVLAVYEILEKVGIEVKSKKYLKELEAAGAKVDFSNHSVHFKEKDLTETANRMKEMNPSSQDGPHKKHLRVEKRQKTFSVGNGANLYFDWDSWQAIQPTEKTLRDIIRWGEGWDKVSSLSSPVLPKGVNPLMEPMYSYAIMVQNSHKKKVYHYYPTEPIHVKYLSKMAKVVEEERGYLQEMDGCEYMNSPLRFGERAIRAALARIDYGACGSIGIGTMNISGLNSPVSVAGQAILSVAEVLGALTVVRLLRPKMTKLHGQIASGQLDMSTGRVIYSSSRCHLQQLAGAEIFRKGFGCQVRMMDWYRDANEPGLQACYEFAFIGMFFHALVAGGGHSEIGGLGNGNVFSPEQAVMDVEMMNEVREVFHGFEVSEEALALDTILEAGFDHKKIMESNHTFRHFRENLPFSQYFLRGLTATAHHNKECSQTKELLDKAHQICLEAKKKGEKIEPDIELGKKLYEIVKEAAIEAKVKAPPPIPK